MLKIRTNTEADKLVPFALPLSHQTLNSIPPNHKEVWYSSMKQPQVSLKCKHLNTVQRLGAKISEHISHALLAFAAPGSLLLK